MARACETLGHRRGNLPASSVTAELCGEGTVGVGLKGFDLAVLLEHEANSFPQECASLGSYQSRDPIECPQMGRIE